MSNTELPIKNIEVRAQAWREKQHSGKRETFEVLKTSSILIKQLLMRLQEKQHNGNAVCGAPPFGGQAQT